MRHGDGFVWSYDELRERAGRSRGRVEELAHRAGQRGCCCTRRTRPRLIAAWLGILRAGGIVVATMPLLRAGEIAKVIAKAQVTHALVDGRARGRGRGRRASWSRCSRSVRPFSRSRAATRRSRRSTTGGRRRRDHRVHVRHDRRSRRAACTSTATCSRRCDTFAPPRSCDPQPDDVFSGTPPLAFTFGLGGLVLFPLRFGASTAPCATPGPDAMLEAIARARDHDAVHRADRLPRAAAQGRAGRARLAARVRVGRRAAARGRRRTPGSSRPASASSTASARPRCCTSSSRSPAAEAPARLVRAAGARATRRGSSTTTMQTLPPGEVGRLAVRGPTGCRYLDDPRQSVYVVDGWNLTGDAFSMDEDGYFWFQARTDDMIISSGYNISGFEVEAALLEHPAVAECAVVAAPDEERGHVVKAFVVGRPARRSTRARRRCRTTSRRGSRRTSTRAGSSSSTRCRARRPARSSATCLREAASMRRLQPPGWPRAARATPTASPPTARLVFVGGQIGWDETGAFPSPTSPARSARRCATSSPCSPRPAPGPSTSRG